MADKLPFLPFYVNDWETDEKVRAMGPATRGYYLSLLIMEWREGSIPADIRELKRILKFPLDPVIIMPSIPPEHEDCEEDSDLLDYDGILEQCLQCFVPNGKTGRLINTKLELVRKRHIAIREAKSEGGKRGRMSQLQSMPKDTPSTTMLGHSLANQNQIQNQIQKEHTPKPPKGGNGFGLHYPPEFESLWKSYPRKDGKGAAWKAYQKISPTQEQVQMLLRSIVEHRDTDAWRKDNGQFIPHLSTYLNQRRWEDEEDS